ncbi:MAG TPA: hypothetical protein VK203_02250 [Nostocaceae cyanobacterium]|nr:hypothetical protein [Nostocaceae cyanobacterium]
MNITQVKNIAKTALLNALVVGGTIAVASPASAITFTFSGTVTEVDTSIYFDQTREARRFNRRVRVGTPFLGKVTYGRPDDPNVGFYGSSPFDTSYSDSTSSSGIEVTVGPYTFFSTNRFRPIYNLSDPTNPYSLIGFHTVRFSERNGRLHPEVSAHPGTERFKYGSMHVFLDSLHTLGSLYISSAAYGSYSEADGPSDFQIQGDITYIQLVPETSSTLGTIAFAAVGTAVLLKRKKNNPLSVVRQKLSSTKDVL